MTKVIKLQECVIQREMYGQDLIVAGEKLVEVCTRIITYIRSLPRDQVQLNLLITIHILYCRFMPRG